MANANGRDAVANAADSGDENFSSILQLKTKLVYDGDVSIPPGVTVISAEPSVGHLPSSNLYLTCKAPYLLLLACSDEHVRFFECVQSASDDGKMRYDWKLWGMVGDSAKSSIEMDGEHCSLH
ncbi:unnamed protein product [Gongylonema pulchrum]|uniref:ANAPC4_WD40 domain-containing protein n=1 Tax=Gongylonema pulchrum TaxID=637853 RepID=A0A183DD90_9BILA|nr:unnamed protein product [Gongylonema pulchrum]